MSSCPNLRRRVLQNQHLAVITTWTWKPTQYCAVLTCLGRIQGVSSGLWPVTNEFPYLIFPQLCLLSSKPFPDDTVTENNELAMVPMSLHTAFCIGEISLMHFLFIK